MAKLKLVCHFHLLLFVLLFSFHLSTQLQPSESQSLLQIRELLNYPQALANFDNFTDFCDTESTPSLTIVCYEGYITQLHIVGEVGRPTFQQNTSADFLFSTFSQFPNLKVLSLVSLGFERPLPPTVGKLLSLEILNLSSNSFYGSVPEELSSLKSLQTLILDYNHFSGNIPSWIDSLPVLTTLSLQNNSFNGSLPDSITHMWSLRVLSLSKNSLSGKVPDLSNLTNVQVLDLGDNLLGPQFPKLPKRLSILVLKNNRFRSGIPAELAFLYRLEKLDISSNKLVGPFLASLLGLPSIKYLNIGGNRLTGLLLRNVSCNSDLTFVNLSSNLLTGDLPTCLQQLESKNNDVIYTGNCLVGVKDNICTAGMPSTGGSRILDGYRPPFDATAVRRIKELGGIVVGKTNLDEFGMGSTTEASAFQVTANPWDLKRVPGGSSGGSASAVSARQCVVSLGSDTGGSVRQPASFCGVVGLKPTYGRVSRFGLMAYASSLDVIGCLGTTVADAGILLHAISGHDTLDATSSKREVHDFTSQFTAADSLESKPLKGLRIGLIRETLDNGVDGEVSSAIRAAASHLEELGCSINEVSLPSFSLGLPAYYILASSESSSNLARYDGVRYGNQAVADELTGLYQNSRATGFGSEVKMRILMGTYALSAGYYDAYYKRAQQVRSVIQKSFKAALDENDILISPAAPSAAYKIGEKVKDPLAMYAGDIMTVNVNLGGLPALVLPCGFVRDGSSDLPVGLQMIGAAFDEGKLVKVGHIFEQTLPDCRFVPPLLADHIGG